VAQFTVRALKPRPFANEPKTLAEHLRKRRLELGLTLKELGRLVGVCEKTVINWENGRTRPQVYHCPALIHFLGYDPF
jgi:DNA-binding XRE family transcriptional regulator